MQNSWGSFANCFAKVIYEYNVISKFCNYIFTKFFIVSMKVLSIENWYQLCWLTEKLQIQSVFFIIILALHVYVHQAVFWFCALSLLKCTVSHCRRTKQAIKKAERQICCTISDLLCLLAYKIRYWLSEYYISAALHMVLKVWPQLWGGLCS